MFTFMNIKVCEEVVAFFEGLLRSLSVSDSRKVIMCIDLKQHDARLLKRGYQKFMLL